MFNHSAGDHTIKPVREEAPTRIKRRQQTAGLFSWLKRQNALIELFYSFLVGAGAFLFFFACGFWMFADPNPENGQIGGLILGPVMGLLFFGFAWGYFGQRRKWPQ